ncbi:GPI-anchor transamidase component PIGS-like [Styela clava]
MESLNDRRSQMQAALCMGFVFLCFGIPIWWKTTEVYRADIPYSEISDLVTNSKISTKIIVTIASISEQLNEDIKNNFEGSFGLEFVQISYEFDTVVLTQKDIQNIKHQNNAIEISSIYKNDITLVFEISSDAENAKVTFQGNRILLIEYKSLEISKGLMKIINENIVNAEALNDAVGKAFGANIQFSKDREFHMRKTVQPDKGYDIVFSLLCPEPDKLQATWNMEEAVDMYLKPMIKKLGNFAEFHIGSQILYYSGLSVKPKSKTLDNIKQFYLTHEQLSHVVNPIESRLGAQISPNPTLNFVVYMSEDNYNPLYIQHADESYSTTNTFLVPRWGSIMIKNAPKSNDTIFPHVVELDSVEIMQVFVAQLRSLLGLEMTKTPNDDFEITVADRGIAGISDLELSYLVRKRTFENIATSVHAIHTLSELLGKIHNIVINDEIAGHIYTAVDAIKKAKASLDESDDQRALNISNIAFKASETAFFDPTLLELLYFPEDQKFAIYIPLFLPISLPLLGSFIAAIKWLRMKKGDEEKQKTE